METNRVYFEAIALRKCIRATYNRMVVTLAPHILYKRHDELYIDAVTIERDGAAPREAKLGTFKVDGLNDPRLDNYRFRPFPAFRSSDPKYAGATVASVRTS